MEIYPDSIILKQVIEGKPALYSHLVDRYGAALQQMAWQILKNHELAKQVVLQVFAQTYRNLRRLPNTHRFFPYLMSEVRRIAQTMQNLESLSAENFASTYESNDLVNKKYVQGLSYTQISATLGIPENDVEKHIREARRLYRWSLMKA